MSVDTALRALAGTIESGQPWPRPRCPDCNSGHIRFGEPSEVESHASAAMHGHPGWDPDWIYGTFSVRGECENPGCRQTVHGTGDDRVDIATETVPDDPWDSPAPYSAYYRIAHLHPPLLLMPIPKSAPDEIREGLLRASRVLFADLDSPPPPCAPPSNAS